MHRNFIFPMACYATIAVLAFFTLEGVFRVAVWVFVGGLAAKTWIHAKLRRGD